MLPVAEACLDRFGLSKLASAWTLRLRLTKQLHSLLCLYELLVVVNQVRLLQGTDRSSWSTKMLALPHDEDLLEHNDLGTAYSICYLAIVICPSLSSRCLQKARIRLSQLLKPPVDDTPEGAPGPHESNGDFQS